MNTISETFIITWVKQVSALEASGAIMCPLMTVDLAKFDPSLCGCDIPNTREHFLAMYPRVPQCAFASRCVPTDVLSTEATDERNPPPPTWTKRPRGSWIMSFKRRNQSTSIMDEVTTQGIKPTYLEPAYRHRSLTALVG